MPNKRHIQRQGHLLGIASLSTNLRVSDFVLELELGTASVVQILRVLPFSEEAPALGDQTDPLHDEEQGKQHG